LASAAEEVVDGVRVFGGLVLDYAVGGLNPAAVEQTLLLGGKVVWLPTTGSRQDCHLHGFPSGHGRAPIDGRPGIPVVDDDGRLLPVMHEIFDLITEHDAVLATGHTTLEEHYAVARAFGSTGRVIATHVGVQNAGPGLDVAQCAELAGLGLLMEFSALTAIDHMGKAAMPMAENAALIRAAGVDHAILSSDYGWYHELPRPVPGLQAYFGQLWDAGFTEDELRRMACDTPARLIGLA
jgi:hypothetical protein